MTDYNAAGRKPIVGRDAHEPEYSMSDPYLNLIDTLRKHIENRQRKLATDNIGTIYESRDSYVRNVAAYKELETLSSVMDDAIKMQNRGGK